ncbi:MAG: hypothetical protein KDI61_06325, partial [Alphaproteobacteria bacterium]|nr:hypothetical protein [Alphaproteobacteria bacterium]
SLFFYQAFISRRPPLPEAGVTVIDSSRIFATCWACCAFCLITDNATFCLARAVSAAIAYGTSTVKLLFTFLYTTMVFIKNR